MQTFLPYESFVESARCLDRQRLGKQRVEVLQLLKAIRYGGGWSNHPAAKMWQHCENALVLYGGVICAEWINRGYKDNTLPRIAQCIILDIPAIMPAWLGNAEFHLSHQSNLVRKLPTHYRQYFPDVPDNLPYVWP